MCCGPFHTCKRQAESERKRICLPQMRQTEFRSLAEDYNQLHADEIAGMVAAERAAAAERLTAEDEMPEDNGPMGVGCLKSMVIEVGTCLRPWPSAVFIDRPRHCGRRRRRRGGHPGTFRYERPSRQTQRQSLVVQEQVGIPEERVLEYHLSCPVSHPGL